MSPTMAVPLLQIDQVHRHYRLPGRGLFTPGRQVLAVNGVSLDLAVGDSLGLVGESGCGKSTLARLAMALEKPSQGRVLFAGQDLAQLDAEALRQARRDFQMVFQDPYGSLDPRQRVGRIVAEPLEALERAGKPERLARVAEALDMVGLRTGDAEKYPHEFSGGQRQRIAIARALITRPKLIVADEPVSALDVSVQASVLNLLRELQQRHGITYLFISHNLAVVSHLCRRVAVMYLGRIVEQGDCASIFQAPAHPYTRALLAALPQPVPPPPGSRRRRQLLQGSPGLASTRPGCALAERCGFAVARCHGETPALRPFNDRLVACHRAEEI